MVQAISANHMAEQEMDSELESDQEQLDIDFVLNMESENESEWLDSPQQVYSVTICKFPTAADILIEMQGCTTYSLFDTEAQVSCVSYDCYREFIWKQNQYQF